MHAHGLHAARLLALLGLLGAAGCGGNTAGFVPVAGRVTLEGRPLTTGSVSFRPDAAAGNTSLHHPTGEIDAQGNYELVTAGKKGAPPGKYRVLVFAAEPTGPGPHGSPVMPKWLHHVKYTTEQSTDLTAEVVAQPAAGAYDLKLRK